ncbi:MAG: hypothetical protein JXR96_01300 [Deltaproteobacteria bacterium]|nr:hypothetical protein [Deltaproteobacteria bacterium]
MKGRRRRYAAASVIGLALCLSCPATAGADLVIDLSGGVTFRPDVEHRKTIFPGGGIHLDAGYDLGLGFSAMGVVWWDRQVGMEEQCYDCPRVDALDTLVTAVALRYTLPVPWLEIYLQAGPAFVLDVVEETGGWSGEQSLLFHRAVFVGSAGLGIEIVSFLVVGLRFDSLVGADTHLLGACAYTGLRF